MTNYTKLAAEIGSLVTSKQAQYGDSVSKSGKILEILYPEGVQPHQYRDALLVVRILDKLSRIAQRGPDGQDLGGESPYRDIAGYGLLGASKDEAPAVEDAPQETVFDVPEWARWIRLGPESYHLVTEIAGHGEIAHISRSDDGLVGYWAIPAPGAHVVQGAVDDWAHGVAKVKNAVNWQAWQDKAYRPTGW